MTAKREVKESGQVVWTYGKAHCKNKECGKSWGSMTQLRKARRAKPGPHCPECGEGLTRRQAVGL